jgi:hypothetical protein
VNQGFFKTGPGEYGEGDIFIGVRLPAMRAICRECRGATLDVVQPMLCSPVHEERALALLMLVDAFRRAGERERREIYAFYLSNTHYINNLKGRIIVSRSAGRSAKSSSPRKSPSAKR